MCRIAHKSDNPPLELSHKITKSLLNFYAVIYMTCAYKYELAS